MCSKLYKLKKFIFYIYKLYNYFKTDSNFISLSKNNMKISQIKNIFQH